MTSFFNLPPDLRAVLVTNGINLIAAILTLAIGWTIAKFASRWLRFALDRLPHFDNTLKPLLTKLLRYGILALTFIIVLQRFGVETTSLIAVIGAAGLAVGLALQGTLSNVASGAMLLILRPFQVGDYIDVNGTGGTVREIGLFTTILITADLVYVSMPNSMIFSNTITNYSREPNRRINLVVGIDYDDDIDKAQKIALDLIKSDKRILTYPEPIVPVGTLNSSSVDLILRCWVPTAEYWNVLFDLQKNIKLRFDAEGISIPFPQQTASVRLPKLPEKK
ncbi:MAG TPA: mechanosensitive ion channel domain-containing protein [Rhizomicrobium sp.]|nr:mechanosensitive ion channel domain-containing protein [Rhizomicrobium sp.]